MPTRSNYRFKSKWRGIQRQSVLARHGGRCVDCGDAGADGKGKGLVQAHRKAHNDGGADTEDNIVLLCRSCHALTDENWL